MRGFSVGAALAASTVFVSSVLAQSVDPIVIKGSKFFYKTNGTQFFIRGVAYQQDYNGGGLAASSGTSSSYVDPLADSTSCLRDIPYLTALRTNVIRVYAIDPTKNHDTCMNALAAAGIYVISDLSDPTNSINRNDPSWNNALLTRYTSVVDALAGYTNTMGFFAGNEVTNNLTNTEASAFVRAAIRDTKAYISQKGYRPIGVGYASDDDANIRDAESDYLNCGDQSSAIDFWGYNIYEWCGSGVTYQSSGYADRTAEFANYSVPVFFAEYGCIKPPPRTFDDTPVLLGPQMDSVWSGGIVYMYFQEDNGYGLVSIDSSSNVQTLSDYNALSSQIATVSPSGINSASYTPSNSPRSCPATGSTWQALASPLPPTPNAGLCQCMYDSLTCVVSPTVSSSAYGQLFGTVCGLDNNACLGINTNTSVGNFGPYSMCNATQQLAYALNQYYLDNGSGQSACNFGGSATIKAATSATGGCSASLASASTQASQVTATNAAGSSSKSGSAVRRFASSPVDGTWQMGTLISIGLVSALGMIVL